VNIVVLVSANAEWEAVKSLFPDIPVKHSPYGENCHLTLATPGLSKGEERHLTLYHSGWGKISSAAVMQYVIDHEAPGLIVNLGTCGGFDGCVRQGDVILVEKTFVHDIVELMETDDITPFYASSLDLNWLPEPYPYPVRRGILASADSDLLPERIAFLQSKGAIAADWESGALAWVAQKNNARLLILRAVSDVVGEQGSDTYGGIEVFRTRCRDIMKQLFDQLPGWLRFVQLS
jgi:adenosylhomocysteine nucleosidase